MNSFHTAGKSRAVSCRAVQSTPTKVTRTALQNAASIAGLLLTTESVVVERPEKDKAPSMPGGRRHGRHVLMSLPVRGLQNLTGSLTG
jgi:hypothetical protein